MRYSVWDPRGKAYDYYETSSPADLGPPNPRHISARSAMGAPPAAAAWPLPADARRVGRGPYARGLVAETSSGRALAGLGDGNNWVGIAGFVAAALLLWRYAVPRRTR